MGGGTLMFGLGATRAGSTWLYRYLSNHPDCALPRIKELHYFDALDLDGRDHQIKRMTRIIAQSEEAVASGKPAARLRLSEARAMLDLLKRDEDIDAYLALVQTGRGATLHGDITPA